jgi:PAS domain S-box-containing protein
MPGRDCGVRRRTLTNPAVEHAAGPRFDDDAALRAIVEGTATETGQRFFGALVEALARALGTTGAWVTEYDRRLHHLRALAFWCDGRRLDGYEYALPGTPCGAVVDGPGLIHIPDRVIDLYPDDPDLERFAAVSYLGVPLCDVDGTVLGHLAVLDQKPLPAEPRVLVLFRIFAARAAAELQRLRAEAALRAREAALRRLIDGALDAIVELDADLRVTLANAASERTFACTADTLGGREFTDFLTPEAARTLRAASAELTGNPGGRWLPDLVGRTAAGRAFPAEATLSRSADGRHTLVLRDVSERVRAERTIEVLRDELRALRGGEELLGESACMRALVRELHEVAETEAAVMLLGETGTGKGVVARALHAASRRREKPLVTVNCAAVPATLIESEFFGHERGAFTGATQRRDGRFALADGGTLFLDEVGELPLDLQVKLLRVLQDGEFEPVGSSVTRKVDVRVVAATNRDLAREVREGRFREDLYYRLNVFPIRVPPLRERGGDVALLARAFAARAAARLARRLEPLGEADVERLVAYSWPGNVRELEHVIERAVITAREGRLNLDRALPSESGAGGAAAVIRTAAEMEALERENLVRALEACGWQVAGANGAARRLGLSPSTLASRLKALGITRPR